MKQRVNVCLACGACCAHFRASFYYRETDEFTPGGVPASLTEPLTDFRQVMKGTKRCPPRCIALDGVIGSSVSCTIHARRASVCREFPASFEDGVTANERCDQARAAHGLSPLKPEDWWSPEDRPRSPDDRPDNCPDGGGDGRDNDPGNDRPDDFPLRPAA